MKLSENTLSILKNFATINPGIVLKSGKVQRTVSPDMTILAEVTIDEDLPSDFGIYDLPQFLGNVTTLDKPELVISSQKAVISDGFLTVNYYSCSPTLITTPPDKTLEMKSVDVQFKLTTDAMQKLLRLAAMNDLATLTVVGKNGELLLKSHQTGNDTSNTVSIRIGDYDGADFEKSFKVDNLKMIPNDYDVSITFSGFALFENKTKNLKYFIALESKTK